MIATLYGPMAIATQRWITFALGKGDREFLKKVFSVCLSSQIIIAVILFIVIEFVGVWYLKTYAVIPIERLQIAFWVFQLSTVSILLTIINVPFYGAIIAHEKVAFFTGFAIIEAIMKLIICFALCHSPIDKLLLYSILLFLVSCLSFMLMQIYARKRFEEAKLKLGWDKQLYKEICSFAAWDIIGNLAFIGYTQGITMLINLFYGPALNAAAGIGAQATNLINQLGGNFQTALNPQITKYYASGDLENMHKLIFRSVKFSVYLMLIFIVPFFYEADFLLQIWLGKVPDHSVAFMRIGLFVCLFVAMRNPLTVAAMATGNVRRYQLLTNVIILLVCPISYILYKLGGVPETGNIVLVMMLCGAFFVSIFVLKDLIKLNSHFFSRSVIWRIILVTAISFLIPSTLYSYFEEGWVRLFVLSFISILVTILLILMIGVDSNERQFILNMAKNKVRIIYKNKH